MQIIKTIQLDLNKVYTHKCSFEVRQGDNGRYIQAKILLDTLPFKIPDVFTAKCDVAVDNHSLIKDKVCEIDRKENIHSVLIPVDEVVTDVAGEINIVIKLYKGEFVVSAQEIRGVVVPEIGYEGVYVPGGGSSSSGGSGKDGLSAYQIAIKYGFKGTEEEWLESLKGQDGKSGIYRGTEQPTDPDIEIWIDPNGDTDEVILKDGLSAFEIAQKNGFEGTEEQWLESLKGADGKDGTDGTNGKDGYTPIKGIDYFTEEDKTEIANLVLDMIPVWNGGSY